MSGWHALAVCLPRAAVAGTSRALLALGATGLQEDVPPGTALRYRQPWDKGRGPRPPAVVLLRAWFDQRPADDAVRAAVGGRETSWEVVAEQDWNEGWKAHFQPVRISERLVVAAPWHGLEGAVVIEPGNAFGTGDHVTTRSCLVAIDRLAVPGQRLLDVGCGSGILAVAAARLGMVAHGVDTDPTAVQAARVAARVNDVSATFDGAALGSLAGPYELVVANLYAEVIADLAPELRRLARGHLVFAGILSDRAVLVVRAMSGLRLDERLDAEGWTSLVYTT